MQAWQDETIIIRWFTIGIIVVLIFSISLILLLKKNYEAFIYSKRRINDLKIYHQKKLEFSSIKIQEYERERIGSDLHDSIINSLNILYLKSQIGIEEEKLIDNIQQTINLTRQLSHDLNPPLLEFQTIEEIFRGVLEQWNEFYNIEIKINVHESIEMSIEQKKHLIRILQELMSNMQKHSKCTIIQFHLRLSKKFFAFLLKDNGIGFNQENTSKGLGIKNMTTRASILKAIFRYKKNKPNGTTFLLLIVNAEL